MAIAQVTIVPIGTGSTSLSDYVADLFRVLEQEAAGLRYELTPMSTIIEGELDDILRVIRHMHEAPFLQGALRVSTSITIDDRRDKKGSMQQKLESVERKLGGGTEA
ncbi:MTH1187 family thiamine-binding protein [Cohnella candidum]|uniref:MTH1187 family thiamine-binding protein n=1 Tax=Cohnella candidum TaxID=2674991 RepID=A0A3G3JW78_9BACL|nr:MTH1187 family thiamine-binding protein [Cohnella candidum]AYQ72503.1 MTH1187 family thiamine-binding protein [Cohnella candidum]